MLSWMTSNKHAEDRLTVNESLWLAAHKAARLSGLASTPALVLVAKSLENNGLTIAMADIFTRDFVGPILQANDRQAEARYAVDKIMIETQKPRSRLIFIDRARSAADSFTREWVLVDSSTFRDLDINGKRVIVPFNPS